MSEVASERAEEPEDELVIVDTIRLIESGAGSLAVQAALEQNERVRQIKKIQANAGAEM
jgi:hypothetical protein